MKLILEALRNLKSFCLEWPELFESLNSEFNFEGLAGDIEQAITFDRNLEQVHWQVEAAIKRLNDFSTENKVRFNIYRTISHSELAKKFYGSNHPREWACHKVFTVLKAADSYLENALLMKEHQEVKQGQYQPE